MTGFRVTSYTGFVRASNIVMDSDIPNPLCFGFDGGVRVVNGNFVGVMPRERLYLPKPLDSEFTTISTSAAILPFTTIPMSQIWFSPLVHSPEKFSDGDILVDDTDLFNVDILLAHTAWAKNLGTNPIFGVKLADVDLNGFHKFLDVRLQHYADRDCTSYFAANETVFSEISFDPLTSDYPLTNVSTFSWVADIHNRPAYYVAVAEVQVAYYVYQATLASEDIISCIRLSYTTPNYGRVEISKDNVTWIKLKEKYGTNLEWNIPPTPVKYIRFENMGEQGTLSIAGPTQSIENILFNHGHKSIDTDIEGDIVS
jgi:hypothetical protein